MKKVLSVILTPLFFLFFGLTLVVFHIVQLIALRISHRAHDKSVAILNFCLMRCTNILGTRTRFKGFINLPTSEPYLFISNHQSMWDIPPLIWKLRKNRPKFIAKASLAKHIPSISINLQRGGSVAIDRNKPEEAVAKIEKFAHFIKDKKFSICMFPEGTRSRDGIVKTFKAGGIDAILNIIPTIKVVPIGIKNTGLIDNNGKFLKRLGIKTSFIMLPARTVNSQNLIAELDVIKNEIADAIA
ncbi:lysophospholipid acyltransferase family protein [Crocinitomix catalasitica]|uniref:lysophospholipid acyltransferase family protein n=1 Tax=Crocinitomix catalasitica TaxID=184607 RepID=UPI0004858424|nr:lysophospholipid acyltransferase family protein [Crocinitomix catalasitica]